MIRQASINVLHRLICDVIWNGHQVQIERLLLFLFLYWTCVGSYQSVPVNKTTAIFLQSALLCNSLKELTDRQHFVYFCKTAFIIQDVKSFNYPSSLLSERSEQRRLHVFSILLFFCCSINCSASVLLSHNWKICF